MGSLIVLRGLTTSSVRTASSSCDSRCLAYKDVLASRVANCWTTFSARSTSPVTRSSHRASRRVLKTILHRPCYKYRSVSSVFVRDAPCSHIGEGREHLLAEEAQRLDLVGVGH